MAKKLIQGGEKSNEEVQGAVKLIQNIGKNDVWEMEETEQPKSNKDKLKERLEQHEKVEENS